MKYEVHFLLDYSYVIEAADLKAAERRAKASQELFRKRADVTECKILYIQVSGEQPPEAPGKPPPIAA